MSKSAFFHYFSLLFAFVIYGLPANLHAQNINGSSPYSNLPFGEVFNSSYSRLKGMGLDGVSSWSRNNANLGNPALLYHSDEVNMEAGLMSVRRELSNETSSKVVGGGGISNISISFPVWRHFHLKKRWKQSVVMALYINPYTAKDYTFRSFPTFGTSAVNISENGSGNINQTGFSIGTNFYKGFSLGLKAGYLFGKQKDATQYIIPAGDDYSLSSGILYERNKQVSSVNYEVGASYRHKLNKATNLDSTGRKDSTSFHITYGLTVSPPFVLGYNQTSSFGLVYQSSNGSLFYPALIDPDSFSIIETRPDTLVDGRVSLTTQPALKAGITINKEYNGGVSTYWQLNLEGGYQDFSPLNTGNENFLSYTTSYYGAIGFELIPYLRFEQGYFNLISYRVGFRAGQREFAIDNKNIQQTGINFGLGLPLSTKGQLNYKSSSPMVNLYINRNQLHGVPENGVKTATWYFGLGLILNDAGWFKRRAYD